MMKIFFEPFKSKLYHLSYLIFYSFIFVLLMSSVNSETAQAKVKERIQIWHQMMYSFRPVLQKAAEIYEQENPDIRVEITYRETEELRAAYQSSAMGGSGPDLIYGPSDQVGPFATMKIIQPMENIVPEELMKSIDPISLVKFQDHVFMMGDTLGNFLMLLYNKKLVSVPPKNTDEMIEIAKKNTLDLNGDGHTERYGLVWNMTEPFFFVPWVTGFGEPFVKGDGEPNLNTDSTKKAFAFMQHLNNIQIVPKECDYEVANALFKEGNAAMIINGDWSWGDYQKANIDFGIARIPMVKETGLWPSPLVGTRGYSLNVNIKPEKLPKVVALLKFLLSPRVQLMFTKEVNSFPSSLEARQSEIVKNNPLLQDMVPIMEVGIPMPIAPEIRAVWDSLRPEYQSALAGKISPLLASENAQKNSLNQIKQMNEVLEPNMTVWIVKIIGIIIFGFIFIKIFLSFPNLIREWKGANRFAQIMMLPSFIGLFIVIVYPFVFNLIISVSNLSLKTFSSWELIGFHHYIAVLQDPLFYSLLLKTLVWTSVGVFFHVFLGVILALIINQTLPAKGMFRTLLIIPWAVPQYITALTWRGMFNQEYGAINIMIEKYLNMPPIHWLTEPFQAFSACILTNIWLGFPFMMVISLGGLQSIPSHLYEAAKVDGASAWQRFWHITWPMLQPVLLPAITLGSIWTFNMLNVIWLVSNSGEPADKTHILVSYVYKSAFNLYRYGYAAALSVVIFLILLIVSALFLKWKKATESLY